MCVLPGNGIVVEVVMLVVYMHIYIYTHTIQSCAAVVKVVRRNSKVKRSLVIDLPSHPLRSIYHEYEWLVPTTAVAYTLVRMPVFCKQARWTRAVDSVISLPSSALFWVMPFSGLNDDDDDGRGEKLPTCNLWLGSARVLYATFFVYSHTHT